MLTIALIRHAAHALGSETLVGRSPGVRLSPAGAAQAEALALRFGPGVLAAVYSSPRERARATAAPLAARMGLEVRIASELDEIDFGAWTGRTLAELEPLEDWRRFNLFRSGTRAPGGEAMVEVQNRLLRLVERLVERHDGGAVALVSHGDVIRAALAHWLGVPLDLFQRLEVSPGSLSLVRLGPYGPQVLLVNGGGEDERRLQASPTAR